VQHHDQATFTAAGAASIYAYAPVILHRIFLILHHSMLPKTTVIFKFSRPFQTKDDKAQANKGHDEYQICFFVVSC